MNSTSSATRALGARQHVSVFRVPCRGPGDLSAVQALIDTGELIPQDIVAVMGKTEGNGCVNDFTREYAAASWGQLLAKPLDCSPAEAMARVGLVMSGGTEGVLSPHCTIFARRAADAAAPTGKRLVIGVAHTRDFLPEEVGSAAQIDATAQAVQSAMTDAGIVDEADVHFVQVKCPLLTSAAIHSAHARGAVVRSHDTYESMAWSRGASALGVGLALGEVGERDTEALAHCNLTDFSVWSARASASAGIELQHNVVLVLGMAEGATSPFVIDHGVMQDAIDAMALRRLLQERLGLDPDQLAASSDDRLVNVLAKAEADPRGGVRGHRHTMLTDSDFHSTRHARAAVGAVLASVTGRTPLYVSGGAEHQGPPGGGPVAAILRVSPPSVTGEPK